MAVATKQDMLAAVFCDHADGQAVYSWLTSNGYATSEINVLMSEGAKAKYYSDEEDEPVGASSYAAEGVATGGAIGAAVGAAAAAMAAIGASLVVPGLGLVIAGPLAAAFAGAGAGAVTGGIVGGLVGLGIPESNAKAYEEVLREGGMAIAVVPHSSEDGKRIRAMFKNFRGENIVTI
jgi:hypothetical protein